MATPTPAADRLLGLLGLGFRGRLVIIGVDRVREALQAGKLACVVVASDVSERAKQKVVRLAAAKQVPLLDGPTADEIGARLGRPGVMVAGVLDRALALGLASASHGRPKTEA